MNLKTLNFADYCKLKNLLVLIYSKLHSKSCDYLYITQTSTMCVYTMLGLGLRRYFSVSPYLNSNYSFITLREESEWDSARRVLFNWRNFEKYMIFYTLPWSRWKRTQKLWNTYVRCTLSDSRIRSEMSWGSTHTKIWTLKQLHHCTQRLNHKDISM